MKRRVQVAKLTKAEARAHKDACALLSLGRALRPDEIEFVYRNWREDANHVNSIAGAFFTPADIAWELAVMSATSKATHYVDVCAGTGVLSWALLRHSPQLNITAIEINPDYVEVGKRLLPNVNWIRADVFDLDLWLDIGPFFMAVSNPPFGRPPALDGQVDWLKFKGEAHFMVTEIVLRAVGRGVFIFPSADLPFTWNRGYTRTRGSRAYRRFRKIYPEAIFEGASIDVSVHRDKWHGVKPNVDMAQIEWSYDAVDPPPVIVKQGNMF